MNGYTPWELASLKRQYHALDTTHKGFLDRADVCRLVETAAPTPTSAHLQRFDDDAGSLRTEPSSAVLGECLYGQMDRDGDGRVAFDEFLSFLATTPTPEAAAVRARMLERGGPGGDWSMLGLGIGGLLSLFKAKATLAVGAFFSDPIRLFRDYYVEYTSSVSSHGAANRAHTAGGGLLHAVRQLGMLSSVGWVAFSIGLDSAVGVAMFLVYAKARAVFADALLEQQRNLRRRMQRFEHVLSPVEPFIPILSSTQHVGLDCAAGAVAGGVSGLLEAPAQAIATSHLRPSRLRGSLAKHCHRWHHRVYRGGAAHAAFFSTFGAAKQVGGWAWFFQGQAERTTMREAFLTAGAGCMAGAAYRTVAVPIDNWSHHIRHHGKASWERLSAAQQVRVLRGGLGRSLAFTMPVTGVLFLGYEYALVHW